MLELASLCFSILTLIIGTFLAVMWLFRFRRKEILTYADCKDFIIGWIDWLFNIKLY